MSVLALIALLLVATWFSWPVPIANGAPMLAGAHADPNVLAILQRSCGDCHSDSTYYPWYSYVAPVSFLIRRDVLNGRRHLNFSHWNELPLARKERRLSDIANQVTQREMPLWYYTLIHRNARLSETDIHDVFQWTQTEKARLIAESQAPQ